MSKWTNWIYIDKDKSMKWSDKYKNTYGVYKIRIVQSNGKSLKIRRINKIDPIGLIYIGRSGYQGKRTIATRIREFLATKSHSGGITYAKAKKILEHNKVFKNHLLKARAMFIATKKEIFDAERRELECYFEKFAELPPCNSSLPKDKQKAKSCY